MPYLPAPPADPVSPSPPLEFLLARLRKGPAVETELFDDMHVLEHFSEAYQRACERAEALQAIQEITLTGAQEYPLPDDHHETLSVYLNGYELERLPMRNALFEGLFGYYEYGDTIGFRPVPDTSGKAFLLYARTPPMFEMYDDVPEAGFPPEFYHLLIHYCRWKSATAAGGAQRLGTAAAERDQFDLGCMILRTRVARINAARAPHIPSLLDNPRRRTLSRLANDVDAG